MIDLEILDRDFNLIYVVDSYASLLWTERYNEASDFEIVVPANDEALRIFQKDRYIRIKDSSYLMVVETLELSSSTDEGPKLNVSGKSLEYILARRIIWDQTILSGTLQAGIETLLNENAISPSIADRAIPNLIFSASENSELTELTLEAQYTGKNLYDVISDICKSHNLGFRIRLNANNKMVFTLFKGTDRTYNQTTYPYVIFSTKFDNLNSYRYLISSSVKKTVTLVAGEGDGSERRKLAVGIDSGEGSGLDRYEMFSDRRDISSNEGEVSDTDYEKQLEEAGKDALAEVNKSEEFDADVDGKSMFVYGKDYFMGDILQLETEYGIKRTIRVTELIRSFDSSGYNVYPTFSVIEEQ